MKKKLWMTIVGIVAVLAVAFFLIASGKNDKVSYRLEKVDRGDVVVSISATGTLSADTTVQVGSQVSGRIAKIYVDFNSVVRRGQLLAQLDPTFLQAALSQVKAGVTKATAALNQAQRDYSRTKGLFDKTLASQADMDAAVTNLESAQASLEQAKAAFEGADVNLRYATVTSPISGVVISRNVDVGQTVAASLSAPTLFEIANDLRKMQVQASVDEADIGSVKVGQDVTFRVDAFPNDEFQGKVRQVRLAPVITQNVVTYNVIIDVANPKLILMPGMTATVSIIVADREKVLRVPLQATKFTPPDAEKLVEANGRSRQRDSLRSRGAEVGGNNESNTREFKGGSNRAVVWVLENGKPQPRFLQMGIQDPRYAEVLRSKLNEGDQVIVGMTGPQVEVAAGAQNPFAPQRFGGRRGGR